MKKGTAIFFGLTILFSLLLFSQPVLSKIKSNSIIEKDGSILLPSQKITANSVSNYTQAPLRQAKWREFLQANPNWTVLIDKATLTPHIALGKPIQIRNFSIITEDNVQSAAMQFLRDYSNVLNLNPDNLVLTKTKNVKKLWLVGYKQVYKGIEVLLSNVELRIRDDGKVVSFGVDYYNDINVNTTPTISWTDAMTKSYTGLKFNTKIDKVESEGRKYILPVKFDGKVKYNLVFDVKVETSEPLGKFTSFVNAHSGQVVWRFNKVRDANTTVNTKGLIKEKYSFDQPVVKPFPNSYFKFGTDKKTTDKNGIWSDELSSQSNITAMLEGKWAKVIYYRSNNDEAVINSTVNPGDNYNIDWSDNNSHKYERMLYYHTNYIHDYLKVLDSVFDGMDFQVVVTIVREGNAPNASSDGRNIYFFSTDLPQYKFAETPSVLYHEYTHSVNAQIYLKYGGSGQLGMVNGSCNEAMADVGSALMIDDEMIGRGAFSSSNTRNIRTLENEYIYPDSIQGESHNDGMILSGAFWDLKKTTSREIAEQVSHYTKYLTPDDLDDGIAFNEWFLDAIITDDDIYGDNDPSNGTPHLMEIVNAFNEHHIGTDLILALSFDHTPLADTKNTTDPYVVTFDLKSTPNILNSHPDSIYVVYSTDNFKSYNMSPAVKLPPSQDPLGTKYSAPIPAMPSGTMVKYYIQTMESVSKRQFKFTGVYPEFKPYVFLVGYETLSMDDMEKEPDWTVGSAADTATTGIWEWAVPKKESLNFGGGEQILQPNEDHSAVGTKCFVTGANVGVSGPITNYNESVIAMQYMPNGTTTLTSRIYDLSKVEKAVARFYSYFSSEFWIVNIPGLESKLVFSVSSNGGSSWTNVDTIKESTWDWVKSQVLLEDYVQVTNRMRFKFTVLSTELQDGVLIALTEGLVDDFEILYPNNIAPPSVIANFGGNPTIGVAPLSVQFTDSSKGTISSWWWDFGDGSNSTEKNPVHQYSSKGVYNVSLSISDGTNQDTKTRDNYITVKNIMADFSATPLIGLKPLEVQFTDKSGGTITSRSWDFGDGEYSEEQNPKHTFYYDGPYSVMLTVMNQTDSSRVIKEDYIMVYDGFGAHFTSDTTSGTIPLRIQFTDQSFGNPTSWDWDFGDGNTSKEQNPYHIYTTEGIFTVSLTASGISQNSTRTMKDYINAYRALSVDDGSESLSGLAAFPNPFSSATSIYYNLLTSSRVTLRIYDLMGNVISSLIDENQSEGKKVAVWNGVKSDGSKVNPGIYFYRLQAGSKTFTGKLLFY